MKRLELFFRTHKRAMVWLIISAVIGIASLTITGIGVLWKLSLDNERELASIPVTFATLQRIEENTTEIRKKQDSMWLETSEIKIKMKEHDVRLDNDEEDIRELKLRISREK